MADRTMKAGDTWPPLKGEATDENGLVDLTTAAALQVVLRSGATVIEGVPVAIDPPEPDADGIHSWNWKYIWVAGDTATPGDYTVELKVTWGVGKLETFPNSGAAALTIEAL